MSKTRLVSDLGRLRATASTGSPLILPSAPHFWIVTRGVFLIRLVFHEPSSVLMSSLPSCGTPQTGVGLGRPSFVKVVSSRYFSRYTSSNVGAMALEHHGFVAVAQDPVLA